jgi:hypothetical protein
MYNPGLIGPYKFVLEEKYKIEHTQDDTQPRHVGSSQKKRQVAEREHANICYRLTGNLER